MWHGSTSDFSGNHRNEKIDQEMEMIYFSKSRWNSNFGEDNLTKKNDTTGTLVHAHQSLHKEHEKLYAWRKYLEINVQNIWTLKSFAVMGYV